MCVCVSVVIIREENQSQTKILFRFINNKQSLPLLRPIHEKKFHARSFVNIEPNELPVYFVLISFRFFFLLYFSFFSSLCIFKKHFCRTLRVVFSVL